MKINLVLSSEARIRKSIFPVFLFLIFFNQIGKARQPISYAEKLLSKIDWSDPRLKTVKETHSNSELALQNLLDYYRKRTFVKHPIDKNLKTAMLGKFATQAEIETADNALKHIFVGQTAYPPYFCGTDIDWASTPVPDNEWVWQLNRMYFWDAMASAYWHTGDEKYAEGWCSQLVDWTIKNPNDDKHKYSWRSIEAGIRGYRWTALFQYFVESPHFTPEVLAAFLNSCYDHAEYLMTKYSSKSNWGLMEAEGLAFIAITFPEFKDSDKWMKEAIRRLNNEIDIQVYPDGHQRELAMGYHLGCIQWFMRTCDLAKLNGKMDLFPPTYLEKIEKMCEIPLKICHPDGTNAQFGDSWAGYPGQHQKRFEEWAERFNRDDFLYLASEGKKGIKPNSTAYALSSSGLYSMRSSWDKNAICLVLKCGPDGGAHCQPDNGTFELSAGGRNLMPDAGSYIYSGDPENRAWFRQTKVHQTLTLNGKNSKYAPKLLLWKPGEKNDILVVENKSYDNLTHRRSLFFIEKKYFIIVDEAIGNATGDIDIHFQLAPGKTLFDFEKNRVVSDFAEGWNVMVQALCPNNPILDEEEGQVSFVYTKKEPRPAFRYRINKNEPAANIRFVTLVVPYENEASNIPISIIGDPEIGTSELKLQIEENGEKKCIGYSL